MIIPNEMIETIKTFFYDKQFKHYTREILTDSEGATYDTTVNLVKEFYGNAQSANKEMIQKKYGIDIEAEFVFTFSKDNNIALNDIIEYLENRYIITKILVADSHITCFGKRV